MLANIATYIISQIVPFLFAAIAMIVIGTGLVVVIILAIAAVIAIFKGVIHAIRK